MLPTWISAAHAGGPPAAAALVFALRKSKSASCNATAGAGGGELAVVACWLGDLLPLLPGALVPAVDRAGASAGEGDCAVCESGLCSPVEAATAAGAGRCAG